MKRGYTSANVCRHWFAHDSEYCGFLAILHAKPMRDVASFTRLCLPDAAGNRCDMMANDHSVQSTAGERPKPETQPTCGKSAHWGSLLQIAGFDRRCLP